MAGQADLKKVFGGGGGDIVNSIKEIFTEDLKYTDENDAVWLRTGWVDTNIGLYPAATKTTIPLDVATDNIGYAGTGSTSQVDHWTGGITRTTRFAIRSDLTYAAVPCGTPEEYINNKVLYTNNAGLTWTGATITAETTYNYENAAFSPNRCMFVGFSSAGNSTGDSRFVRSTQNLTGFETPVALTFSGARHVCWTGNNFLILNIVNKLARVPETTSSITYLPDAPFNHPNLLMSPATGIALCANTPNDTVVIYRTTDEGANWTSTFTISDANWGYRFNSLYKEPASGNLILVVTGYSRTGTQNNIKIYVSTNDGVTFAERSWSFTWDGVTYNNVTGWPSAILPAGQSTLPYNGLCKTGGVLTLAIDAGSSKLSYLQSSDNGLNWTITRPAVRAGWGTFLAKGTDGFFTVGLANNIYGVVGNLVTPNTNPVVRLGGTTTFVGVTEELSTPITTTSSKLGKYVRIK